MKDALTYYAALLMNVFTSEYDIPVSGIFHFFGGIGTNWYRKKVSEPVSAKFDTGTDFRRQNVGILKIYNGYRYRMGTGTEIF